MARLAQDHGWRSVSWAVAGGAVVCFVLVFALMRDRPADLNLQPYGWRPSVEGAAASRKPLAPLQALAWAIRSPAFWILAGSFFICGASTNGLIGTHLIPACHDYGIPEVRAAGLLAVMGFFDIVGTTGSGWLTDRFSSRYLLFAYYALRGLSLLFLPQSLAQGPDSLNWFAVFYGLDWIATVPPTVRLTSDVFGRENAGVIFGWIGASHQIGASLAAFGAGTIRTSLGDYRVAFWAAGAMCFVTGFGFLLAKRALSNHTAFPGEAALALREAAG